MVNGEPDPAMVIAQDVFDRSGKTLEWLGEQMGHTGETARKSAWQFLKKTADPRLSMLRRFAKAMGIPVAQLVSEPAKRGRERKAGRTGN